MAWTLGGIRTFVQESKEDGGQIIPRLQPLSGGTVLQVFGYESTIRTLNCIVVGDTDKNAIKDMRTGGTYALVGPEGSLGSFLVKNVTVTRVMCIKQTLRLDLDCEAPVYNIEVQLYDED